MRQDADKLKELLDLDDIRLLLKDLGSGEPKKDRDSNLIFTTCCHGGNAHKLYYYDDSQMFRCYTDCGESFSIYNLIINAKSVQGQKYSFPQAIRYVTNITGKSASISRSRIGFGESDEEKYRIDDWDWLNRFKRKDKVDIELPNYNKNVLDVFLPYGYGEWEDEGISLETQRGFGVGWYLKGESIIIPHYSIDGDLIGIRQRNTRKEDLDSGRKYMPVTVENRLYTHPLGMNIYGLHKTVNAVKRSGKLLLFEGEKSCMKAQDWYGEFNFTGAVCGSGITGFQRDIILSLDVDELFLAFDRYGEDDNEKKIQEYKDKLLKLARMFTPYMRVYILWADNGEIGFKESPVDRGRKVFEGLMRNKYEIGTEG